MMATDQQLEVTMNKTGSTAAWQDKLIEYVISHSGALIAALVVVVIGFIAARWVGKLTDRWLTSTTLDPAVRMLLVCGAAGGEEKRGDPGGGRRRMNPPVRFLLVLIARFFVFVMALVVALGTA